MAMPMATLFSLIIHIFVNEIAYQNIVFNDIR